jgi:hypothetical protein
MDEYSPSRGFCQEKFSAAARERNVSGPAAECREALTSGRARSSLRVQRTEFMGSIRKEIIINASAEKVWDAVRDIGALHRRFVPGLVTDVRLEEGARVVTFANGMVVRELIVDLDDRARRLAYAAVGGSFKHHHASMQVFPETEGRCRLVWMTDLLPDELLESIGAVIEQGAAIMKQTLEQGSAG